MSISVHGYCVCFVQSYINIFMNNAWYFRYTKSRMFLIAPRTSLSPYRRSLNTKPGNGNKIERES